jgi:hypothetical protein
MAMKKSPNQPPLATPERRTSLVWAASAVLSSASFNSHAAVFTDLSTEGIDLVFPRLADTGNAGSMPLFLPLLLLPLLWLLFFLSAFLWLT